MEVIYGLIPSVIFVGGLVVIAIIWAAKRGQFDDLDGAGSRILMDDDDKPFAMPAHNPSHPSATEKDDTEQKNTH